MSSLPDKQLPFMARMALVGARDYLMWLVELEGVKKGAVESVRALIDKAIAEDDRAAPSAKKDTEVANHAEVIGNVTAALLDLDATYVGNQVTFTFQSTNDAMSYIRRARLIVEERLALIRASTDGSTAK